MYLKKCMHNLTFNINTDSAKKSNPARHTSRHTYAIILCIITRHQYMNILHAPTLFYAVNRMNHSLHKIYTWWDSVRVSTFETLGLLSPIISNMSSPPFPVCLPYMTPHISSSPFFRLVDQLVVYASAPLIFIGYIKEGWIQHKSLNTFHKVHERTFIYLTFTFFQNEHLLARTDVEPFASWPIHRMVSINNRFYKLIKFPFLLSYFATSRIFDLSPKRKICFLDNGSYVTHRVRSQTRLQFFQLKFLKKLF